MPSNKAVLKPSNFETIDSSVFEWVDKVLDVFAHRNDGFRKVPVIWLTAERAFQMKNNKEIRSDDSEALIFPLITIERTTVEKTKVSERPIPGHLFPKKEYPEDYKGGAFYVAQRIQQDRTRNFAGADRLRGEVKQVNFPNRDQFGRKIENKKVVYKVMSIPMPTYYDITYNINLRTDYQQQMNELMQPFMTFAGGINQFMLHRDGHSYEAFIQDGYDSENNLANLAEDEKKYETTIKLKVIGQIVGAGQNQDGPRVTIRENKVQVRFPREHVMLGDINDYGVKDGKEQEPYIPRHKDANPFKP